VRRVTGTGLEDRSQLRTMGNSSCSEETVQREGSGSLDRDMPRSLTLSEDCEEESRRILKAQRDDWERRRASANPQALFAAASNGDMVEVGIQLANGVDVNQQLAPWATKNSDLGMCEPGDTVLHVAFRSRCWRLPMPCCPCHWIHALILTRL